MKLAESGNSVAAGSTAGRLALGAVLALVLVVTAWSGVLDRSAAVHYEGMLKRALVTFAVARSLNGIISVIKETEVAVQPAGVGVKLAPGQILDPVNDLVEQFSWIMLASAASLGIQRLLMEISHWPGMTLVLGLSVLIWWACLWRAPGSAWRTAGNRMLLLAVFLRFAVPVVVLASDLVFQIFLDPTYTQASEQVEQTQHDLARLHEQDSEAAGEPEVASGRLARWWTQTAEAINVPERIASYQALFSRLAENIVSLIAVFLLQTILLPLLFLWTLLRIWRQLWV